MSTTPLDSLAQEIRRVDGNHDLGAGALAEALMPWLAAREAAAAQAVWDQVEAERVRVLAQALAPFRLLVKDWKAANKNGPVWALVLRNLDVAIKAAELRAALRSGAGS